MRSLIEFAAALALLPIAGCFVLGAGYALFSLPEIAGALYNPGQ